MNIFRYSNKGTIIHRLNPFCKLVWITSILVFALIFDNPAYVLLILLSTVPLIIIAKVLREWLSIMKLSLYLCAVIIVVNALVSNEGSHVLFEAPFSIPVFGTLVITLEAIFYGIIMCLRLLAIMSAFAILTYTIHPDDLMLVMLKLRLPYKSVLITTLSTRFVPTMIDDIERIRDVQRSRGLELEKGGLIRRIKSYTTILIPLLSNSLDRAVQVAEGMEARAFGSGKRRTFYKQIPTSRIDSATLFIMICTIAFGISMSIVGYGDYDYYPELSGLSMNGYEWCMLTGLCLLLLVITPLAFIKNRIDLD